MSWQPFLSNFFKFSWYKISKFPSFVCLWQKCYDDENIWDNGEHVYLDQKKRILHEFSCIVEFIKQVYLGYALLNRFLQRVY